MALSPFFLIFVALLVISVSFGHIYLGTAGVEGTLGSMTTGDVDEAWAKSHHDRWYAEVMAAQGGKNEAEPVWHDWAKFHSIPQLSINPQGSQVERKRGYHCR